MNDTMVATGCIALLSTGLIACEPKLPTTPTLLAEAISAGLDDETPQALEALFLRGDALAAACRDPAARLRLAETAKTAEADLKACLKLGGGGGDALAVGGAVGAPMAGCDGGVLSSEAIVGVVTGGGRGVLFDAEAPVVVGERFHLAGGLRCAEVPEGAREAFANMLRIAETRSTADGTMTEVVAALRDFGDRWQAAKGRERTGLEQSLACMRGARRPDDLDNCLATLGAPPILPLTCSRYLLFLQTCLVELPAEVRQRVAGLEAAARTSWNTVLDDGLLARLCADDLAVAVRDVKACPKAVAAAFEAPVRPLGEGPLPTDVRRPTAELLAAIGGSPEEQLAAARATLAAFAHGPGDRSPEHLTSALELVAAADPATPVVPTLLRYAFLRDASGGEFVHVVRHSLVKRGEPDIATRLAAIARGQDREVTTFAARHGTAPWELTEGAIAVRLLLDRLDPATVEVFLEQLEAPLSQPAGLYGERFEAWRHAQVERLKLAMFGVGYLGDDAILPRLGALIRDTARDKTNQRLNAAAAVAMIGSEAAQDLLLDIFAAERDDTFRAPLLQLIALALDDRRLKRFDALLRPEDPKAVRSAAITAALTQNDALRIFLNVLRDCTDDRACYLQKLRNVRQDDQLKAIAVLGRGRFGKDPEVRTAILKALNRATIDRTDVRRFGTLALVRLGEAEDGPALVRLGASLDEEDAFWRHEYLQLGTALSRRK